MDDHAFKAAQERRMADQFARALPPDQYACWNNTKHVGRFFLYQDSEVLVVRRPTDDTTEVIDRWRLTEVGISFDHGIELTLQNLEGENCRVTHYPRKLGQHEVFVWIPPYISDTRYLQTRTGYQLSLNICFRSRHAPGIPVEGNVFIEKH